MALTTHTHLALKLKKGQRYNYSPLWALIADSRVEFMIKYASGKLTASIFRLD
jgi:hypothetical protein